MDSPSHSDHSHDDGHHEPFNFEKSFRTYLKVGGTLILFTFITWIVAYYVDLGDHHLNIALGLLIAAFKVSLVCLIFMHLNHERGFIYKVMLFSLIFFAAMMFLFVLAYSDPIKHAVLQH